MTSPIDASLTFKRFAEANSNRSARWHGERGWSPSEWMTALVGEVGEAANIIKKLNRIRDGIEGAGHSEDELLQMLGEELADVAAYLFLLAEAMGLDLETEVVAKFNKVSARHGFPEKLD